MKSKYMKTFIGFRPHPPADYIEKGVANLADEPQYEGVIFSDGSVAIKWLTKFSSHSIWKDYETFYAVHGHDDYGTVVKFTLPTS